MVAATLAARTATSHNGRHGRSASYCRVSSPGFARKAHIGLAHLGLSRAERPLPTDITTLREHMLVCATVSNMGQSWARSTMSHPISILNSVWFILLPVQPCPRGMDGGDRFATRARVAVSVFTTAALLAAAACSTQAQFAVRAVVCNKCALRSGSLDAAAHWLISSQCWFATTPSLLDKVSRCLARKILDHRRPSRSLKLWQRRSVVTMGFHCERWPLSCPRRSSRGSAGGLRRVSVAASPPVGRADAPQWQPALAIFVRRARTRAFAPAPRQRRPRR